MASDQPPGTVIVTHEDPLYVSEFFASFLSHADLDRAVSVLLVVLQPPFRESRVELGRRMIGFFGPIGFGRMAFRYGMALARGRSVKRMLDRSGISSIRQTDVNDRSFLTRLAGMRPDLILSMNAPQIFGRELLDLPRLGCINLHTGSLPEYRGLMPSFWQLYHRERQAGVTVHAMTEVVDGGVVLSRTEVEIEPSESLDSLTRRCKRKGAELMIGTLLRMRSGSLSAEQVDLAQGSYFTFPSRREASEFRRRGGRLV